jgi:hypothetical protein
MRNRPLIYIEVEPDQLEYYGETEDSIFNLLKEYNYFLFPILIYSSVKQLIERIEKYNQTIN